jgi:hypothetical protein
MMSVVEDMDVDDRQDDAEPSPSWDEAVAEWDAGEPADLERPPRKITILYRYNNGRFHATSPDLTGFEVPGPSLHETKQLVRAALKDYLDPAVELNERMPPQGPETESASRQVVTDAGPLILSPTSRGRVSAFMSPSPLRARV